MHLRSHLATFPRKSTQLPLIQLHSSALRAAKYMDTVTCSFNNILISHPGSMKRGILIVVVTSGAAS